MPEESDNDGNITRRNLIVTMGTAALTAGSLAKLALGEGSQGGSSDAQSYGKSKPSQPDPKNPVLQGQNPDSFFSPPTDSGDVKPFKYSFELGRNKIAEAGWARQVTVHDLPISTSIAGVNMRLNKGAVRELHWHQSAEWAFMIYGTARITGVDVGGKSFVSDVGPGDLWYFPSGIPHSIQGIGEDGCEFLLVFDDGAFSEFETFLITDWMAHTPPDILAKNFGVPEDVFKSVPKKELYIFTAPMPDSIEEDRKIAAGTAGSVDTPFSYRLLSQAPDVQTRGGEVRIVDSTKFKASKTISAAHVRLKPGGLRELHWHPNADEWQYYIKGKGKMTVFTGGAKARTMDFQAGDVGYIQNTLPHYIENTGDTDLEFLETFKSDVYQDLSLSEWLTHLPPKLVASHLKMDEKTVALLRRGKPVVVPV